MDPHTVAGLYRFRSPFASVEVRLRGDGSFTYEHWSCLDHAKTEGRFQVVAPGALVATSREPRPQSTIEPSLAPGSDNIKVLVRGPDGSELPGASVTVECGGADETRVADIHGLAVLAQCPVDRLRVELSGFVTATAEVGSSSANQFVVTMAVDELRFDGAEWTVARDGIRLSRGEPIPRVRRLW